MEKFRFIHSKKDAEETWKRRAYYRMEHFLVSDLLKMYSSLFPQSGVNARKNHYRSFAIRFGQYQIKHLTTSEINQWFQIIRAENDLTERTLAQVKCQLNVLFKWLEYEKILDSNPLKEIVFKRNQKPKRSRIIFDKNQVRALAKDAYHFDSITFYPFLYTLIHTGARRSEIQNLRWKDLDLSNKYLMLNETKNGESRRIQLSKGLYKLLKSQSRSSDFVFSGTYGHGLSRPKIQRTINSFKECHPEYGNWNYHDLRHSFAFNFLNEGGEMYQLQAILGHKTIKMTVDLYGHFKSQNVANPSPYSF